MGCWLGLVVSVGVEMLDVSNISSAPYFFYYENCFDMTFGGDYNGLNVFPLFHSPSA
jgi:hypothetical protein